MDEPSSGRTYDPKLGRFLQADPFIQAAGNTQSYNRYSYVVNNPLNKIDPSGYISLDIMKGVRRAFFKMIGPEASQALVGIGSIFCGPFAPLCAAAGSYDASRANGSSMAEAMHTATYSGVSAAAFNAIGGIGLTPSNAVLASAFVGGTMAYGQGGKFGHGFLSAGIGAAAGAYNGEGVSIQGFVVSSVAGGTASYLTGGKFGNGAASAAFSYAMTWGVKKYGAGGDPVTAEKTGEDGSGGVDKSAATNLELQKRAKEIADQIDIPDADYEIRFASAKEIKAVTKGQAAWGTVTKVNGRWTILMEETLSTRMGGTRFIQTVAEELVHVEQLSTGYYKNLNPSTRRYALETEATGWVMSYAPTLGLKGADYKDYTKIHNIWESKWKKQLY